MPRSASIISNIIWQNIAIEITYTPIYSDFSNIYDDDRVLSHIELRTDNTPLPLIDTGYRSIFFYQNKNAMLSSVDSEVIDKLNIAATSQEWQKYMMSKQQPSLF